MATVIFSSELQKLTGEEQTSVKARIYKDIIAELITRYSSLEEENLMKMAIAIDGEIVHNPLLEVIDETSELHFLYRISGG
jgi:molybdopterin converting factor small subunit